MAKISAHGAVIGTIDYITKSKRYMSDGKILMNAGFGWKIHGKVKPESTPLRAYESARDSLTAQLAAKPHAAAYRKALHSLCGMDKRWKLHAAVSLMPDDADGVWSEVCDGYGENVHSDIDEIVDLCMLYRNMMAERVAACEPAIA